MAKISQRLSEVISALGSVRDDVVAVEAGAAQSQPPKAPAPPDSPTAPAAPSAPPKPPTTGNHNGWQFFDVADQSGITPGSLYGRFGLQQLYPSSANLDLSLVKSWMNWCKARSIKLSFRVMFLNPGSYNTVQWMRDAGYRGSSFTVYGANCWHPDVSDSRVKDALTRLYGEMAKLGPFEYVDAVGWGLWGEQHIFDPNGRAMMAEPSLADQRWMVDLIGQLFPKTPKVALLKWSASQPTASAACKYALDKGWGWRVDSAGDPGYHGTTYYPNAMREHNADKTWEHAPVALEPSGTVGGWDEASWRAFEKLVARSHATYMHNKSAPLDASDRQRMQRNIDKMKTWRRF